MPVNDGDEIKAKQFSVADIRPHGVHEGSICSIALANPHEALDAVRQGIELRDAANVCQIKANGAGQIVSIRIEVAVGGIVERASRPNARRSIEHKG